MKVAIRYIVGFHAFIAILVTYLLEMKNGNVFDRSRTWV